MDLVSLLHDSSLNWIPYLVGALFIISFGGVLLIFTLCIVRRIKEERVANVVEDYREKFVDIVCSETGENLPVIDPSGWERPLVRNLLLTTMASVQGEGKKRLMKIYQELLFLAYDYVSLKSSSFSVRLGAIARLETVRETVSPTVMIRLLEDKSPYVHFAALRFLLKKNKGYYPVIEVEMRRLEKLKRYDMALEILNCYAQCCPDLFIQFLEKADSRKIRIANLEIIYKKHLTAALPFVRFFLEKSLRASEFSVGDLLEHKKAIQCLSISPLPENEDLLMEITQNKSEEMRILAFRAWLQMRPDCFAMIVSKMLQDPSPQIQNVAQQLRQREESREEAA